MVKLGAGSPFARRSRARASSTAEGASKARNKATFKPVVCQMALTVKGGLGAGRPQAVDTALFKDEHFVKMHKLESWVCHAVAGKAKGLNPLRRTKLLDKIADMIAEATEEKKPMAQEIANQVDDDDCMADLGLDGPAAPAAFAPAGLGSLCSSRAQKAQAKSKRKAKTVPVECKVLTLSMPPESRSGSCRALRVLTRPPNARRHRSHVWVSSADVPWLLESLHRQWVKGGVDFSPEPVRQRKPYWQIRDRSWQVRARLPSGDYKRKNFTVPWSQVCPDGRRSFISAAQFAKDKEAMYLQAVAWQDAIEAGLPEPL